MRDDGVVVFRHVPVFGIERTSAIADRKVVDAAVARNAKVNMSEKTDFLRFSEIRVGGTFPPVTHCIETRRRYCCCDKRDFRMSEVSRLIEC